MTPEQKQRIEHEISNWRGYDLQESETVTESELAGMCSKMAALLQELVEAPEHEPFGYFKSEPFGWTDCAETDDGSIALYTAPPEPKPVARVTGYYGGYLSIATVDGRVLPAGTALYATPPAPSVPDGWIRAIDEAMVVHHIGIADRADSYEVAKKKLNALLAINSDIARDCSEAPADLVQDSVASEPVGYLYTNLQSGEYHVSDYDDDYRGPERALWRIEPVYRRAKGQQA